MSEPTQPRQALKQAISSDFILREAHWDFVQQQMGPNHFSLEIADYQVSSHTACFISLIQTEDFYFTLY